MTSGMFSQTRSHIGTRVMTFRLKGMASVCSKMYASLAWRDSIPHFSQTRRTRVRFYAKYKCLNSAQGTGRRRGHGGALHRDGSGGVAGLTAKSRGQAAAETVEDPEGPAGADQWTPALSWEGSHGRPSKALVHFGPLPPGASGHSKEYCHI